MQGLGNMALAARVLSSYWSYESDHAERLNELGCSVGVSILVISSKRERSRTKVGVCGDKRRTKEPGWREQTRLSGFAIGKLSR